MSVRKARLEAKLAVKKTKKFCKVTSTEIMISTSHYDNAPNEFSFEELKVYWRSVDSQRKEHSRANLVHIDHVSCCCFSRSWIRRQPHQCHQTHHLHPETHLQRHVDVGVGLPSKISACGIARYDISWLVSTITDYFNFDRVKPNLKRALADGLQSSDLLIWDLAATAACERTPSPQNPSRASLELHLPKARPMSYRELAAAAMYRRGDSIHRFSQWISQ